MLQSRVKQLSFKLAVSAAVLNQLLARGLEEYRRAQEENEHGLPRCITREVITADVRYDNVPVDVYLQSLRRRQLTEDALPQFCVSALGSLASPRAFFLLALMETGLILALHGILPLPHSVEKRITDFNPLWAKTGLLLSLLFVKNFAIKKG